MAKGTFIVYDEIKDTLDEMTDEEIGRLFRAMVDYHVTGEDPELEGGLKFAFIPIRQQMDRDDDKWNKTREARAEAGKKGGAPKGNQNAQKEEENKQKQAKQANGCFASEKQAKQAVNVNVNVNEDVDVNVDDYVIDESSNQENDEITILKKLTPREQHALKEECGDPKDYRRLLRYASYRIKARKDQRPISDYFSYVRTIGIDGGFIADG